MPKRRYEASFYYQVTLVREGTIEVDVPADAAPDYNPFEGKEITEVIGTYEKQLGEAEMIVDDETPEGERLVDIVLYDSDSDSAVRASRLEGSPFLVASSMEMDEDEEEDEE